MTIQQLLSVTIPWELLYLLIPIVILFGYFKIKDRIQKQREEKIGRRKHFFS